MATYLLEGVTRLGYAAWPQPISALNLGTGGWVEQVNFIVYGVLLVLSAVGWYRLLTPGRDTIWFPLLQGIGGLCLMGAGVYAILATRALPRWTGWSARAAAILSPAAVPSIYARANVTGFYTADGLVTVVSLLPLLLWLLIVGISMVLKRKALIVPPTGAREPQEAHR